jgi:hypothetical protein
MRRNLDSPRSLPMRRLAEDATRNSPDLRGPLRFVRSRNLGYTAVSAAQHDDRLRRHIEPVPAILRSLDGMAAAELGDIGSESLY